MGGKALEVHDLSVDGDLLAEELDALGPFQQMPAQRPLALEAHEHHGALRPPEVVLEVMADPARITHAGSGNNDLGGAVLVQRLGLLAGLRHPQVGEVEHMGAVLHQLHGVVVQIAMEVAGENRGGPFCKGRVDIHREIRIGLDHPGVLDLPDEVQEFLGAAHGKGGDDDIAAPGHGLVDDPGQVIGIAPDLRVVAVAVSGLHHHVIGAVEVDRIPDDGLLDIAQVTGKDDALFHTVLRQVHGDARRTQQMARVHKLHFHALAQVDDLPVLAGGHELPHPLGILDGVERVHMGRAGPLALAVFPLGVLLLDMGRVQQHDVQQLGGEPRGEDLPLKALLDEHGDPAGVVDMGVGHQQVIDGIGREGKFRVGYLVPPLLQPAVHQDALSAYIQTVTAAGHALIGAKKAELHVENLLVVWLSSSYHVP